MIRLIGKGFGSEIENVNQNKTLRLDMLPQPGGEYSTCLLDLLQLETSVT